METYDDRPISMYDNLTMSGSMHTSTPKQKPQQATTAAAAAARSPYNEITFQFDDNHKLQQQQQQQQPQQQQHQQLLPNGNNIANQNQQQQLKQVQLNTPHYATPFKPATSLNPAAATTQHTAHATQTPLTTQLHNLAHTNALAQTAATTTATITPTNAFSTQRPLSQHSQSELNESIQSIAAVKAALNDAKSKFFGLNGYAQDNYNNNTAQQIPLTIPTTTRATAAEGKSNESQALKPETARNQVQIVDDYLPTTTTPPPPKPQHQPKYQNIPENSAIFRNNQPPALPPKPLHLHAAQQQAAAFNNSNNNTSNDTMPSTIGAPSVTLNTPDYNGASTSSSKLLPHATYKQLPLNDIDSAQQPSQAVYMTTTVPQNIKGSKIAGRHTPTRNSLRHSRMLVVNNKNYQGPDYPNPLNLRHSNFTRWLLILQIIIGWFLLCLAVWTFFLAPTTAIQDNPYWSGLSLLVAGTIGLIIIRYQRIKRHKLRDNCFKFLRADSYVLSLLAVLLCCLGVVCAALHFLRLTASSTKCESTNILLEHGSCTCTFNAALNGTDTKEALHEDSGAEEYVENQSYKVEYRDLSCQELTNEWIPILSLSMVFNALGFLVSLLYIVMVICCRFNSKRYYSSVQTSTF